MPKTTESRFEPRFPNLTAAAICVVASLTLLWPLLTGHILFGGGRSDMYIAGYSFRLFGAEYFKANHAIPQWNPYLFGGLPYIAAMHGDIFYPTAWLRWIMPVDLAITWGMAIHVMLAGWMTFIFGRSLRMGWWGALFAGVTYELTGIVASQMSPGHDGKIFVSALAPLACWLLVRAIRDRRMWAWGAFAITVALVILGHYHMAYFLLIALGMWAVYLTWYEQPAGASKWKPLAFAAAAVLVGVGITSLQVVPFMDYIKFSPRAEGGVNTGWAFATSFAMPPAEIFTLLLPQFNGMLDHYWGQNPLKFHTEYIGFLPLVLAGLAWGDVQRRRIVIALMVGAAVFLLFAFGGYSPLYRIFFNVLPYLNKIRAMGMVFYLPAFCIALLAGIGLDRVLARGVAPRTILIVSGAFGLFALLGVVGGLQPVAESMAIAERAQAVQANAGELRTGALRLLVFVLLGGGFLWAVAANKVSARIGALALLLIAVADLWSIDNQFYEFSPRADKLFADDAVTSYLKKVKPPYRALEVGDSYGHSVLMAYGVPNALGYHGFEPRAYDELGGKDEGWKNLLSPNFMSLLAVRFIVVNAQAQVPGFHLAAGPTNTATGNPVVLYERDTVPEYARVVATAAKVPDSQEPDLIANPRFPANLVATYADSTSVVADPVVQPLPASAVKATVNDWKPGSMSVALSGADAKTSRLVISENWYPDWHATVDGKPGVVRRADHSLLSVDLPPGAHKVDLVFESAAYAKGKMISLVALLIALGMIAFARIRPSPRVAA